MKINFQSINFDLVNNNEFSIKGFQVGVEFNVVVCTL